MNVRWFLGAAILAAGVARAAEETRLSSLDLKRMTSGWGKALPDHSVDANKLRIAGVEYAHGVGTHAESVMRVKLPGGPARFRAKVGVDDEVRANEKGSVEFVLLSGGKRLWTSGVVRLGAPAVPVDVDLSGAREVVLRVTDGGDGVDYDHADWAEAVFVTEGGRPEALEPAPAEEPYVLTPPAPPEPRINGAQVFGARPGNPFLFTIAASGDRPMTFAAEGLPAGIELDPQTGILAGTTPAAGEYRVALTARNARGVAARELRIVAGARLALTPPMGWNSWNCFAGAVTQERIAGAAEAMVRSGLARHGWTYINIDDFWQVKPGDPDPTLQGPGRHPDGRIAPNPRFPDMPGLVARIHALGLKAGIYSSPGPLTCGGCVGSHGHEAADAAQYAAWGFDYLKYDWCTYTKVAKGSTLFELMKPYVAMARALRAQRRDIVYSLCQYGMGNVSAWGDKAGGHCWRTTGDIVDTWASVTSIGFQQFGLEPFAGPGNWNDPDMLVVGRVGWGPKLHPTRLTPSEQYSHISLWCLLAAPLLIGCDIESLDAFTLNLLTNDEVIGVNQDPLGRQAARVAVRGTAQVWAKAMEDGSTAAGLFNLDEEEQAVAVEWADLGLSGPHRVRDLWRQKDLGPHDGRFEARVPRHGCALIRLSPGAGPRR
ncbi:MAG: alpha-galactosidase [Lentisphaerae bacterium]|nr:alpha-galactosidase [Lentisphaerota bacterium]